MARYSLHAPAETASAGSPEAFAPESSESEGFAEEASYPKRSAFAPSKISNRLVNSAYISSAMLGYASIVYESWLLLSALLLFAFAFDAEKRESEPAANAFAQINEFDEYGAVICKGGQLTQMCPPVIITPWLLTFRIEHIADVEHNKPMQQWCRIWRDQVAAADWARLRRIGITLNAPLRRR
ncbi:hypothetical protein CWE08_04920 [Aliidiomarina iranensis]|uniref:Uncharacterized protein n=1 Tax=Aliidiomarina iranensis TaxID=1434071 RepID=A0A432W0V2_9GAMM|nr:hypothetical protein [Aliidiomarina iranensis]RUO22521.1 hypothetical protein CWE08_04920 [Aliidiomarina iranensis]